MTVNWHGEHNWLVPPPRLVVSCIRKLKADRCNGTLIVPEWFSAPFWPFLAESGKFREFVEEVYVMPSNGSVCHGKGNNGLFAREPFSFRMLALRCKFVDGLEKNV